MITVAKGTILNRVSEWMGRKRMSIRDLEKASGISYQTAWDLYHDNNKMVSFDTLAGLCEALGVGVGEIFQYIPTKDNGDG